MNRCLALLQFLALAVFLFTGCASIPPEAPELSAQLGARISAVEAAHRQLLSDFFLEKKKRVDEFVQREWVPLFARELFQDQRIAKTWDEVVRSQDPNDRLQFIVILGPKLQQEINAKRVELMRPLEELESLIAARLKTEYDNMRSINNTLTAFLQSASKVEQNRKRYLEMIGVTDKQVDDFIFETDQAVAQLVQGGRLVDQRVKDTEAYKAKIQGLISKLRHQGS